MFRNHAVSTDVRGPKEYNEAVEAAETLGLELSRVDAYGYGWETPENDPVSPGACGREVDIRKVGQKYFHMALTGPDGVEVIPVACGRPGYDTDLDRSKLVLRFD